MTARVLVAGIGNLFCSDDGFGPEVVRRLGDLPELGPDRVRVVDYGIAGMHLAYDLLADHDALVIVDAARVGEHRGDVVVLEVGPDDLGDLGDGALDAHQMSPAAVLACLRRLGGRLPRTYVVGCRPGSLAEGIGLSEAVQAAVP
ncbi:MAG: hydrogenase maturation protease, partial [Nocardioidaceae bacterium]